MYAYSAHIDTLSKSTSPTARLGCPHQNLSPPDLFPDTIDYLLPRNSPLAIMKVLGIDPGSVVTAFGVVNTHRGRIRYVDSGCIRTKSSEHMENRLTAIYDGVLAAIEEHKPDSIAIEAIFQHRSSESALRLGQARGVALLAIGKCGYLAAEYNPMTVKKSVGAHGRADKKAVANIVELLLGVKLEGPADITDALAIAITHCAHAKTAALRGA